MNQSTSQFDAASAVALLIGLAAYFAPAIVARVRKHQNFVGLLIVNIVLGWTIIGWVAALIWSFVGKTGPVEKYVPPVVTSLDPVTGHHRAASFAGSIQFDGVEIKIKRRGGSSLIIHGLAGEKVIILHSVQAVQLRMPKGGIRGYLQLTITGGIEARGGAFNAASDENSILFDKYEAPAFQGVAEAIRAAVRARHALANAPVVSRPSAPKIDLADELAKLADLRDRGVLTEEEFQAQKSKLLGQ